MTGQLSYEQDFSQAVKLLQAGNLAEAERRITRLAEQAPNRFEPHHLGAVIAFQSGRQSLGIERLNKALQLQPDHAQGLSDLGMMLNATGARDAAEKSLVRALEISPDMAAAHLNLGMVLADAGRLIAAEKHYREALRLQPKLGAALNNLSRILLSAGRAEEAADLARKLITLAPRNALGHNRLASAMDRLGRLDEAIAAHERAVALNPGDSATRLSYANSLAGYGRIDDATTACRKVLERNPDDLAALAQLASLIKLDEDKELLGRISDLWQRRDLPAPGRAGLGFPLARAAEKNGDYAGAFSTLVQANRLMREQVRYDPDTSNAIADDVIEAFDADTIVQWSGGGHPDGTPIFIVGMPRSGTTLTEQILCAHPGVFGAGEPGVMRGIAEAVSTRKGVRNLSALMAAIDAGELADLGAAYVQLMRQYSADAQHIADKVPANFIFVGLIRLCLPNARIVHCRRAAADTCLSIFKNKFATGNQQFSYDLDDLAAYYAAYQRIMAHWDSVLPGVVHTVQYESMVTDQLAQSKALYAHCGLDWTDDAIEFFKTERPVHTASISQVRQPIYDASSGIAGRYGDAAKPLIDALERAGIDPFAL